MAAVPPVQPFPNLNNLSAAQVGVIQPWTAANPILYNQWNQLPRRQLEPLVWAKLRELSTPVGALLPQIFHNAPMVPSTVTSFSVAAGKDHPQDPSLALLRYRPEDFINFWLTAPDIEFLRTLLNTPLPVGFQNPCISLTSETDVIRATNQYLMPWVETLAQTYFNRDHITISSKCEVTDGNLRYDYVWYATVNGETKPVLLLEFKGPSALKVEQYPWTGFDYAGWRSFQRYPSKFPDDSYNPAAAEALKIVNSVKTTAENLYGTNTSALAIGKQINSYFANTRVPRILVSDYKALALFDYNTNRPELTKANYVNEVVKGVGFSWIDTAIDFDGVGKATFGLMILTALYAGVYDTFAGNKSR